MPASVFDLYALLPVFLLVLFRIGGLMLAAPFFSAAGLPAQIKVLLTVAMSLAVFPLMVGHLAMQVTMASALVGLIGELAMGLLMGFSVSLILLGVELACEAVGQKCGLRLGSVFNPMMEVEGDVLAQLYYMTAFVTFLLIGGHRALMRAVLDSFATIPPLGFHWSAGLLDFVVDLLDVSLAIAIRVGGPAILALLLAYMTLGFVSRTVPQLNILTVGFPIKLALGIFMMALTIMSLEPILLDGLSTSIDGLRAVLGLSPMSG